jgi:cytochrome P450
MTVEQTVSFDPFAEGYIEDPYSHYAALRAHNPVEEHPLGFWALWRHHDVDTLLRARISVEEWRVRSGPLADLRTEVYGDQGRRNDGMSMLDRDPPDHTRLRRLVSKAFTPRTVEGLEPLVQRLVDEALDRLAEARTGNLIDLVAFPLPFQVITDMLGMPDVDTERLRALSHLVVRSLEPVPDVEVMQQIAAADGELQQMVWDAIQWKRTHRGDDLLTALIDAEDNGDVLTDEELVAQVILLYLAGHETTVNLIGNGTLALLRHPEQAALLHDDPALAENAVEELLRYDSPVQLSRRITLAPYDVGGQVIPAETFVVAVLASANRDPAVFGADADALRLDRPNARMHMSFGGGVHHCLGASLARLEARLLFRALCTRYPALSLAGEPVWNGRINLRGMSQLPVSVR